MKWLISCCLVVSLLFITSSTTMASDESPWGFNTFGMGYFSSLNISIDNVPLDMRNVPIHPDDTYVPPGNQGPIEQDSAALSEGSTLFFTFFKETNENTKRTIDYGIRTLFLINSSRAAERNYTNDVGSDSRGYGAALTYWSMEICGPFDTPNDPFFSKLMPEFFYRFSTNRQDQDFNCTDLTMEISVIPCTLYVVNGWDRYDSYEVWKSYSVANGWIVSPSIGFRLAKDLYFSLGTSIILLNQTNNQVTIQNGNGNYFLKMEFEF